MTREDWTAFFDERAGIREFDGGLKRRDAEREAWSDTITEYCRQNPSVSRAAASKEILRMIGVP